MRILIVSQYYYPEQFQINDIAPELVKRGHEVTVLTGLPNYPKGEIYEGYEEVRNELISGVSVIRIKNKPRKTGALNLIKNYLSFAKEATKKARELKDKYDIVLCYQLSPVTCLKPAIAYAMKWNVPLIAYCLDIWPESAKAHLSVPFVYSYIGCLSKKLYRACDHIAVTSLPFIDYLNKEIGYDKAKMSYIPQHADGRMLEMDMKAEDNGVADFMYAGNMGQGQRVEVIIKAAALIKNENFKLHIVGYGSVYDELVELAKQLGISDKVVFYGQQKSEDMERFYKLADALIITLRGNNFVGNTLPAKFQMYMTTGKPIFGAINGAANQIIKEVGCGGVVNAEDYQGLSKLMLDYIKNPRKYDTCGIKSKDYFRNNFTLKKHVDTLEARLQAVYCGRQEEK